MQTPVYDGIMYDQNNQYDQDSRLYVQFFKEAVQHNVRSEAEGRPIFIERDMVRIMTPGSRDIMVGRATPQYQARFPKQWAAFVDGQDQALEGTPLEEVPFLTVGQRAELKALNVRTLEQLAHMSDSLAQQFMGNFALRQKAKNFLAVAKDQAPTIQMQAELAKRDEEITMLKQQMAELISAAKTTPVPKVESAPAAPAVTVAQKIAVK